jgi:UDP-glucose 4-epimerase
LRILVTGASGLLGEEVIARLSRHHHVIALGRTRPLQTCELIPLDLSSDWSIESLPERMDVVIHLAQSRHYREFPAGAADVFSVNLRATAQLLDYAAKAQVRRFILASTGGIYRSAPSPITEDSELLAPSELGFYFATKLSSELLAGTYRSLMDVHILRIFFMYGLQQRLEMFLPSLARRIRQSQPVTLHGSSGIRINPIHVADAARTVKRVTEEGGPKTVNVAGPEILSIRDIAEAMGRGIDVQPVYDVFPRGNDLVASTDEMARLSTPPKIRLSDQIPKLLEAWLPGEQAW